MGDDVSELQRILSTPDVIAASKLQKELAIWHKNTTSKQELMKIGSRVWKVTYAHTRSHDEAFKLLLNDYSRSYVRGVRADSYALLPNIQLSLLGSALWSDCGFPQVIMGHKQAASIMATRISSDIIEAVRPPWPAFYIEVPRGLLFINGEDNSILDITGILVLCYSFDSEPIKWAYTAYTGQSITMWQHGVSTKQLCSVDLASSYDVRAFSEETTDLDHRTCEMISRLIIGVCLSMSDPSKYEDKNVKSNKKERGKNKRDGEPRTRNYVIKNTTTVDCRKEISSYVLKGTSGVPTVQVMVAGHWKMQPYGPNKSLRKAIHIEPYWRGPDDGPILVKPHKI